MKFTKKFDMEYWGNVYTSECGVYELYRTKTYKNNGEWNFSNEWAVQKNGQLLMTFPTLKKAKVVSMLDSYH